jgi:hypothetical protein
MTSLIAVFILAHFNLFGALFALVAVLTALAISLPLFLWLYSTRIGATVFILVLFLGLLPENVSPEIFQNRLALAGGALFLIWLSPLLSLLWPAKSGRDPLPLSVLRQQGRDIGTASPSPNH